MPPHHSTAFASAVPLAASGQEVFRNDRRPVCAVCRGSSVAATAAAAAAAALLVVSPVQPVGAGVISAPECFNGSGPGCEAVETPIIRDLLEKSRTNKEKNDRETLEKYWDEGYKSYFSFGYDRILTRQSDGTYTLERPDSNIAKALRAMGVDVPTHGGVAVSKDGKSDL